MISLSIQNKALMGALPIIKIRMNILLHLKEPRTFKILLLTATKSCSLLPKRQKEIEDAVSTIKRR